VATCRTADGWSAPAFITISGGSWGLQIGIEAVDSCRKQRVCKSDTAESTCRESLLPVKTEAGYGDDCLGGEVQTV
jgi:hypothetical protein